MASVRQLLTLNERPAILLACDTPTTIGLTEPSAKRRSPVRSPPLAVSFNAASLPISFSFRARHVEFAFAPVDAMSDDPFAVHVKFNGDEWGHCINVDGIKGSHERTGIAGWGINGGGIGGLSATEVAQLKQLGRTRSLHPTG